MTKTFAITKDAIDDLAAANRRAAAYDPNRNVERWVVVADNGASFQVFAAAVGEDGMLTGYAWGENTGVTVRFVQTGAALRKGWAKRCRVYTAIDTGDADGTLEFGPDGVGGFFNYQLAYVAGRI